MSQLVSLRKVFNFAGALLLFLALLTVRQLNNLVENITLPT